jgi:hypothetical protein
MAKQHSLGILFQSYSGLTATVAICGFEQHVGGVQSAAVPETWSKAKWNTKM